MLLVALGVRHADACMAPDSLIFLQLSLLGGALPMFELVEQQPAHLACPDVLNLSLGECAALGAVHLCSTWSWTFGPRHMHGFQALPCSIPTSSPELGRSRILPCGDHLSRALWSRLFPVRQQMGQKMPTMGWCSFQGFVLLCRQCWFYSPL